jgi:ABC-type nitrate/sulfonate/bicarbonate transport system substrate-binding protein
MVAVIGVNRGFMEKNRDVTQRLVNSYVDTLNHFKKDRARGAAIFGEKSGLPADVAGAAISFTTLDETLPLQSIKRVTKYLADNGIVTRDVSGELDSSYTYDFLAKATGKTPDELGRGK